MVWAGLEVGGRGLAPARKSRNQKLEAVIRRRQRTRWRVYVWLRRVAFLSVTVALVAGVVQLRRYLLNSPRLALRQIEIEGAKRIDPWEIRVLGKLETGRNLLRFDLQKTAAQIERHPWVAKVRVRRVLPDRMHIDVVEREPVAILVKGALYYVDREGTVFKRVTLGEKLAYPTITGFEEPGPLQEGSLGRMAIREALALMVQIEAKTSLRSDQISEIHVDARRGFSLYTVFASAQIHLGWLDLDKKLSRLGHLLEKERLDLVQVRRVDMDLRRSVVVTPL